MTSEKPIAIIGAGMAGLTAANYLHQNNVPFILYEGSTKIAGLASSYKDAEGFSFDFGAHFITNRLADAIGVSSECLVVKHLGESVWLKGKTYDYPFGLIKHKGMLISWVAQQFKSFINGHPPDSAAEWFSRRFGATLADAVALPLIEAWSGVSADQLSAELGQGLFGGSIFRTLYLKSAAKLTGRAVACGYNKELPETPNVWHVYPEKGISTLCEKLAEGIEDYIKLESPVGSIFVENEKVIAIQVNGELKEVAAVISTAPANILPKIVKGSSSLNAISDFRYRAMVFINLKFEGRGLLPETINWFPEKSFSFFRLTEAPLSMPWLAPEGKTIITADIGCVKNDEIWKMNDEQLAELCLTNLKLIIPDAKKKFLGCNVMRTPVAYPVFLRDYELERQRFMNNPNIRNLLSVGRNGEFSHMFMEDVYWRTRKKVKNLIESNL